MIDNTAHHTGKRTGQRTSRMMQAIVGVGWLLILGGVALTASSSQAVALLGSGMWVVGLLLQFFGVGLAFKAPSNSSTIAV